METLSNFKNASELKKHIGKTVEWTHHHNNHRGTYLVSRGILENVEGRNLVIGGDYFWFANIKKNLRVIDE